MGLGWGLLVCGGGGGGGVLGGDVLMVLVFEVGDVYVGEVVMLIVCFSGG